MGIQLAKTLKKLDWLLFFAVIILFSFGIATIYSAGLGKDPQNFQYFYKQLITFGVLVLAVIITSIFNYRNIKNYSVVLFLGLINTLIIVLLFGDTIRGTKGWFTIGSFGIQPSEFMKIGLIIMLAAYFNKYTRQIHQIRHIFISGAIAAIPIGLVLMQPDFGSAIILFVIWFGMILMSGISKKYLALITVIIISVSLVGWIFLLKDYQKDRITTFLRPNQDTLGAGYNVRQAIIAIGSGQLLGRGFGFGSQSHLKFLPENQTDFIFAVIAEELGLIGVSVVLLFWVLLFHRLILTMKRARDDFGLFMVLGITLIYASQVIVNISGNIGLLPITGIVLPFISYGGSALTTHMIGLGLAESVRVHSI